MCLRQAWIVQCLVRVMYFLVSHCFASSVLRLTVNVRFNLRYSNYNQIFFCKLS